LLRLAPRAAEEKAKGRRSKQKDRHAIEAGLGREGSPVVPAVDQPEKKDRGESTIIHPQLGPAQEGKARGKRKRKKAKLDERDNNA